ncbi:ATP-dependent DNA ligase [Planctomonas sp. JC2975]|uniref:DUF7882 family protein n=1 Tax=Planctomonas sp. JC2975 TaxID=2729626 RepID=UPI00197B3D54|nr:ATP-dependent DNA ligase [Planctomonas sp. JC2975]
MGTLIYGPQEIEFEDRLLIHLEIVIVNKFRRRESFLMSWLDDLSVGSGRSSLWMSAERPVLFKYTGSHIPEISRDWVRTLEDEANASSGLIVLDEAGEPVHARRTAGSRVDRDAHRSTPVA